MWLNFRWGPGPEKRGNRRRRRTLGRIDCGGGNGGEPVRSPLGRPQPVRAIPAHSQPDQNLYRIGHASAYRQPQSVPHKKYDKTDVVRSQWHCKQNRRTWGNPLKEATKMASQLDRLNRDITAAS